MRRRLVGVDRATAGREYHPRPAVRRHVLGPFDELRGTAGRLILALDDEPRRDEPWRLASISILAEAGFADTAAGDAGGVPQRHLGQGRRDRDNDRTECHAERRAVARTGPPETRRAGDPAQPEAG